VRPMAEDAQLASLISAHGAIRCKARRHRWHLRQSWHCGICNLQNLKEAPEFESHSLRQTLSFIFNHLRGMPNSRRAMRPKPVVVSAENAAGTDETLLDFLA
jgi:hypothetical protein